MNHRPQNDSQLPQMILDIQKLAASLDIVTRDCGIRGIAEKLADIQFAARKAEFRCNDILKG